MEAASISKQALRFVENLPMPTVQVVVMRADMSCIHCRQRTARMISKMSGLLDYAVDVCKKEVVLRGIVQSKEKGSTTEFQNNSKSKKQLKQILGVCGLGLKCLTPTP